jgi:hypothetical protein
MSSFGSLWRVKTRQHIRTMNSISTTTGPALTVPYTARRERELSRLHVRRWLYTQRESSRAVVLWSKRKVAQ